MESFQNSRKLSGPLHLYALLCSSYHFKSCVSSICFVLLKCKNQKIFVWFSGWTQHPENHCIMCKAEYISMYGYSSGKHFKWAPHVWEKKKRSLVFFAGIVRATISFLEISVLARRWSHYTIVMYKCVMYSSVNILLAAFSIFVIPGGILMRLFKYMFIIIIIYNIRDVFELCQYRVANLLSPSEPWL